jgi:hypothetical protein
MGCNESQPEIIAVKWNELASDWIAEAARGADKQLRAEVEKGISQLWQCSDGELFGFAITRIEKDLETNDFELVLVAGVGSGLIRFANYFIEFADKNNMTVRTHIVRPGLIKMFDKLGFKIAERREYEIVLRREKHGRR